MAFKKGETGNPGGRPKDKAFAEAVRVVVNRADKNGKVTLYQLAEKLKDYALAGEGWAFQMIADRLDGKPVQESTVTIEDKRERSDWTPAELDALIDDARKSVRAEKAASSSRSKLN